MSPTLLDRLIAEYPAGGDVWMSSVWACLQESTEREFVERKLRALIDPEQRELPLNQILERLSADSLRDERFDIGLVVRCVCAVRLANSLRGPEKRRELAGLLAMRLARALLMLSVDELFAPMAREVWIYSGHTLIQGLRLDGARVRFSERSFELALEYVTLADTSMSALIMPSSPPRRISVTSLREVVMDGLFGLTEPSCTKATRAADIVRSLGLTGTRRRPTDPEALILNDID